MKALKWIAIVIGVLIIAGFVAMPLIKKSTKKHSPEDRIKYSSGDFTVSVFYCRPYKKGREIFGGLEPYNQVWRTGANEPTTITFNKKVNFGGENISAGTYSLWTIPQPSQWTIILNSEIPDWGANFDGKAAHNSEFDVIQVNVPVEELTETVEQLTMEFTNNVNLSISWDKTKVSVPIVF